MKGNKNIDFNQRNTKKDLVEELIQIMIMNSIFSHNENCYNFFINAYH